MSETKWTCYSSQCRLTAAFVRNTKVSLTCGLAVLGVAQVAQGTFVITQVIEGDSCSVHGLEVVPLVAQHLQTVLLHSLVVDQLRLQQARWNKKIFLRLNTETRRAFIRDEEILICVFIAWVNLVATKPPEDGCELTINS